MQRNIMLAVVIVATALGASAAGEDPAEVRAEVPALFAFHEVIFPLWHEAWPNRDVALILELLPQVEEHVRAVSAAHLPGILRDKQARWNEGVAALEEDLDRYRSAAEARETQELLDAVESLHAHFEALVRTVRPAMKELDAYHQVLYSLYHHIVPEGRTKDLEIAAGQLVERCADLEGAPAPRRFTSDQEELRAKVASLCEASDAFRSAATMGDGDAVETALEAVHSRYRETEAVFE